MKKMKTTKAMVSTSKLGQRRAPAPHSSSAACTTTLCFKNVTAQCTYISIKPEKLFK